MSHRNARLTVHGRRLLVQRVREEGWAVAHAAKAMGISRQWVHEDSMKVCGATGQPWR